MTQPDLRAGRTIAQLRDDIAASFEIYLAELKQSGPNWEQKPAGEAEGEDAWCARQVAEHIVSASTFFGWGIATALGLEAAPPQQREFPDVDQATAQTEEAQGGLARILDQVQDEHLTKEHEFPRFGTMAVGHIAAMCDAHLKDHANQLRTLRGG